MPITGNQIRAARSLVGMDQQALAERAKIGINTVRNMEGAGSERIRVRSDTLDAVVDALKAAGVALVDDGPSDGGPGVRLLRHSGVVVAPESETIQYPEIQGR